MPKTALRVVVISDLRSRIPRWRQYRCVFHRAPVMAGSKLEWDMELPTLERCDSRSQTADAMHSRSFAMCWINEWIWFQLGTLRDAIPKGRSALT